MGDNTPFVWTVRVYYEDTDHGGIVYYANYLKFMERARTEHLRSHGFELDRMRDEINLMFAVRRVEVDYLRPAVFNDELLVTAQVAHVGRASITYRQQVTRRREPDSVLCGGSIKIAAIDARSLRPVAMPEYFVMEISGGN